MKKSIARIAAKLGVSAGNISKWKERGYVAHNWRLPIVEAAAKESIKLTSADMEFEPGSEK